MSSTLKQNNAELVIMKVKIKFVKDAKIITVLNVPLEIIVKYVRKDVNFIYKDFYVFVNDNEKI